MLITMFWPKRKKTHTLDREDLTQCVLPTVPLFQPLFSFLIKPFDSWISKLVPIFQGASSWINPTFPPNSWLLSIGFRVVNRWSWVEKHYNFIQFWHCLPVSSIRSHRLRTQSQKIVLLQMPITISSSDQYWSHDWLSFFNSVSQMLEQLKVLRKLYLHVPIYYKRFHKEYGRTA